MKDALKVSKIEKGTVIDHLLPGSALKIVKMLGLESSNPFIVAMNVDSSKNRRKDMIKIEDRSLSKEETDKISLIAPNATINIIKGQKVSDKRRVSPPKELTGIVRCPNNVCVTNREACETRFIRNDEKYKCYFCERTYEVKDFGL